VSRAHRPHHIENAMLSIFTCLSQCQVVSNDQFLALRSVLLGLGCTNASTCPAFEIAAVDACNSTCADFYETTGILNHHRCVTCDSYGSITELALSHVPLNSEIPTTIGLLSTLTWLDLSSCGLSGTVPSQLALLTRLIYLDINSNGNLTGVFPELASLTLLQSIYLNNCNFWGPLPLFSGPLNNTCCGLPCQVDGGNCFTASCVLVRYSCRTHTTGSGRYEESILFELYVLLYTAACARGMRWAANNDGQHNECGLVDVDAGGSGVDSVSVTASCQHSSYVECCSNSSRCYARSDCCPGECWRCCCLPVQMSKANQRQHCCRYIVARCCCD
jgi:hypothetical protein